MYVYMLNIPKFLQGNSCVFYLRSPPERQVMVPWHVKLRRAPSPAAMRAAFLRLQAMGFTVDFIGKW